MFQIDLTGSTAPGDLSPIVSVPIVVRGSQRTLAALVVMLRDGDVPEGTDDDTVTILDDAHTALHEGIEEALAANELVAVAVPPPPPAEEEPDAERSTSDTGTDATLERQQKASLSEAVKVELPPPVASKPAKGGKGK